MILLLAYGNSLRMDDGAGLRLAEQMAAHWRAVGTPVRHVPGHQLVPELAVQIAEPDVQAVVFVDTRAEPAGGVAVAALQPAGAASPSVGHHTQPEVLLAYATLWLEERQAPHAWLVTTPGLDFGHGEGLSPTASAAIHEAWSQRDHALMQLLERLQQAG